MSLVTSDSNGITAARAQCVVRGGEGQTLLANSTHVLRPNVMTTITCVVDDATDTVQVIVNGRTDAPTTKVEFGDVNPNSDRTTCWWAKADAIAVGNKPLCGKTLTADDQFRGLIHLARVLKDRQAADTNQPGRSNTAEYSAT